MNKPVRVCVIGNSHLGAAKRGWHHAAAQYPGHDLTFFGAPWDMIGQLEVEGGALVPRTDRLAAKLRRTSDGLETIEVDAYDRFVLYGLQFGPRRVLHAYRNFRPVSFEWREPLRDLTPFKRSVEPVQAVSERLFDRIVLAGLEATLAVRVAGQISELADRPIHLVAAPGFSARVLESEDWDGPLGAGDLNRLTLRTRQLLKKACPTGAKLIQPRSHLTCHGLFTSPVYAAEDRPDGKPDHIHTSSAYAGEMLAAAVSAGMGAERSAA